MGSTSLLESQKALHIKLTGDATLMTKITGVFDVFSVPDKQTFPYITIGDMTEVSDNTLNRLGKEATITLHIWSQYKGKKEALDILNRLNQILDFGTMTITGQTLIMMKYDNAETIFLEQDGIVHVPARFRIITQEP